MFETYRNSIKDLFIWNDTKYDKYVELWHKHFSENITNSRPALIFSEKHMEHLLALFFVTQQMDAGSKSKLIKDKTVFLSLVTFYIAEDVRLSVQTDESLEKISKFLNELFDNSLIKQTDVRDTEVLLQSFHANGYISDIISPIDLKLVADIITSTNPVVVMGKACMFYFGDPMKTYFKYNKQESSLFTPEQFFDASFRNSQLIHDKFLRELYIANLHHLMDVQANKHIFPF